MTYADNAHRALGKSRNTEAVQPTVTPPQPEASYIPPPCEHALTIRVYDWCPEYGFHTDPELPCAEGGV